MKLICQFLLILCCCNSLFVQAQQVQINDRNKQLNKSEIVYFEKLLSQVSLFYHTHLAKNDVFTIDLIAFKELTAFKQYQKKISKSSSSSNGFYSVKHRQVVVNLNDSYQQTILHEAHHALLRSWSKNPKKWFNEGMSEVIERSDEIDGNLVFRINKTKAKRIKLWHKKSLLPSVFEVSRWSNSQWRQVNKKKGRIASSLSWALIYFLMSDQQNREILSLLIENDLTLHEIVRQHYVGSDNEFENKWQAFAANLPKYVAI